MQNQAKSWYLSKTIWVNLIVLAVMLLGAIMYEPAIPAAWIPYITLALTVLNILLRFVTDGPITTRPTKNQPDVLPEVGDASDAGANYWAGAGLDRDEK